MRGKGKQTLKSTGTQFAKRQRNTDNNHERQRNIKNSYERQRNIKNSYERQKNTSMLKGKVAWIVKRSTFKET